MVLQSFTVEQLAGQRLMVGFDGLVLDAELKYLIDTLKVAGLVLFKRNIESPEQIRRLCVSAQEYARACGQPPLLIAIDQEGGQVARLKKPFTEFDGQPAMKDTDDAVRFAHICAKELKAVGINMNFAPVLDVAPLEMKSIMAGRSFGAEPHRVALMGETVIQHLQENGVMAVVKHFPGIGRTILDSHLDLPTLDSSLSELESFDLIPFQRAINANVAGMMLSHIMYPQLDADWPASLSPVIAKTLLRRQLGYQGVVITDDLDMGAIVKYFGFENAVLQVMAAGIDIALICHRSEKMEMGVNAIRSRLNRSESDYERCRISVNRILSLKNRFLTA
ncbi:MAG: beta-N-acetylhexosaminidase [Desulfobacterales bacterium]|jgi:beta-N-acetylhexosaminidase|nr:beta-N-acetylhexosaminidase [Desulfobacterales bacterium]